MITHLSSLYTSQSPPSSLGNGNSWRTRNRPRTGKDGSAYTKGVRAKVGRLLTNILRDRWNLFWPNLSLRKYHRHQLLPRATTSKICLNLWYNYDRSSQVCIPSKFLILTQYRFLRNGILSKDTTLLYEMVNRHFRVSASDSATISGYKNKIYRFKLLLFVTYAYGS